MKKLLSIILATVMLISLIPAVFAADTETETEAEAGIKIVYDFKNEKIVEDVELADLTFDVTNGFWAFEAVFDSNLTLKRRSGIRPGASRNGGKVDYTNYIEICAGARTHKSACTEDPLTYWIAYKIHVPKTATYSLSMTAVSEGYPQRTWVDAYFVKADEIFSASTVIADENKFSSPNFSTSSDDTYTDKELSFNKTKELTAGDWYFVYDPQATCNVNSSGKVTHGSFTVLKKLTLTEGDGSDSAIMGGKISGISDTLEIGNTATVSATGYFSATGAAISDFTYSVEGDAVELDGNTVTAKTTGTATITATSDSAVSGYNTITKTVKVVEQDAALTEEFIQETDKEELETYVESTVIGIMADDTAIEATPDADGGYNLTASATNEDGEKFLYWALGLTGNKRIVSFDEALKNYVPAEKGRNYLIAVYEGDITDTTNEYYNLNGQLIAKQAEAPDLPSIPGLGTAKKWVNCDANIYVAEYEDTVRDNVTVTVNGGTGTQENVPYGTLITCTADATKANFKCWKKNDTIVSVDESYSFYAWEDCTVEAVYEDYYYTSSNMNILIDSFSIDTGVTGVMAEFIGFDSDDVDVVEKGIMFTDSEEKTTKIPMTTTDNQLTVVADTGKYAGYAILRNGSAYTLITDGLYEHN